MIKYDSKEERFWGASWPFHRDDPTCVYCKRPFDCITSASVRQDRKTSTSFRQTPSWGSCFADTKSRSFGKVSLVSLFFKIYLNILVTWQVFPPHPYSGSIISPAVHYINFIRVDFESFPSLEHFTQVSLNSCLGLHEGEKHNDSPPASSITG